LTKSGFYVNVHINVVNNKFSTKYLVLNFLRNKPGDSVSGQLLADELGISRVAVWKAVQSLQEAGYGICAQGKGPSSGYALLQDLVDSLYPWEFGEMQHQFKHFKTTDSTMDEARLLAVQDSIVSIITADEQTKGRGRLDHNWVTVQNSLSFTLITRPSISLGFYNRLCALSQIALVRVFEKFSGRHFFVRWPNDVWSEDGKAAGILSDVQGTGDILAWVNLGIGINISSKPNIAKTDAVFDSTGRIPARKELLLEFLREFKKIEKESSINPSLMVNLWNDLCPDIGKKMRVKGKTEMYEFNGLNNWAWAQCENTVFPPGDIRFVK